MDLLCFIAIWAILVTATVTDLKDGKIFNWLTLPSLLVGLVFQWVNYQWNGLESGLLGVGLAFVLFFPLWRLKAFAAGDVKLLMAVAAWTSPETVLRLALIAVLVGAMAGVIDLILQKGLRQSAQSVWLHLKGKEKTSYRMPFAPSFLFAWMILLVGEARQWF